MLELELCSPHCADITYKSSIEQQTSAIHIYLCWTKYLFLIGYGPQLKKLKQKQ